MAEFSVIKQKRMDADFKHVNDRLVKRFDEVRANEGKGAVFVHFYDNRYIEEIANSLEHLNPYGKVIISSDRDATLFFMGSDSALDYAEIMLTEMKEAWANVLRSPPLTEDWFERMDEERDLGIADIVRVLEHNQNVYRAEVRRGQVFAMEREVSLAYQANRRRAVEAYGYSVDGLLSELREYLLDHWEAETDTVDRLLTEAKTRATSSRFLTRALFQAEEKLDMLLTAFNATPERAGAFPYKVVTALRMALFSPTGIYPTDMLPNRGSLQALFASETIRLRPEPGELPEPGSDEAYFAVDLKTPKGPLSTCLSPKALSEQAEPAQALLSRIDDVVAIMHAEIMRYQLEQQLDNTLTLLRELPEHDQGAEQKVRALWGIDEPVLTPTTMRPGSAMG